MDIEQLQRIVLMGLYEHRINGGFKSLNSFFKQEDGFTRHQSKLIFDNLLDKDLIKGRVNSSGHIAEITFQGIKYVEENYLKKSFKTMPDMILKMREKYDIILKKLYFENSSKYFEIDELLSPYEKIDLDSAIDIGKALEGKGFVDFVYSKSNAAVKIIANGKEYVEEALLKEYSYKQNDLFTEKERNIIIEKLDNLATRINKIELGQQIIYDDILNEIQSLKETLNVLNKKDWKSLFRGKMVDFGLGELFEGTKLLLIDIFKDGNLLE